MFRRLLQNFIHNDNERNEGTLSNCPSKGADGENIGVSPQDDNQKNTKTFKEKRKSIKSSKRRSARRRTPPAGYNNETNIMSGEKNNIDDQTAMLEPELEIITFSPRQVEILRSSWKVIYSDLESALCYGSIGTMTENERTFMTVAFIRLFQEYPQTQDYFPTFRNVPLEELSNNTNMVQLLHEHSIKVMQVIEKTISRIESLDKATPYLLKLGMFHKHAGIPYDYFGVLGTFFIEAAKPRIQDSRIWSEELEDAWMELFSHIVRVMTHGHKYHSGVAVNTYSQL
ncbi:unnamed protein product [Lepeophtheirus salmonis]|uniref:(salmon louse) hypothetical protein n=2 Tax=Lepeophtheirus salmonis TaxID=72036 RepID=A0A7R8D4G9_LEPSM|nr:unnamed protein product [Lepeophtheirus salmonis]CAF2994221.1 unnamed protein product [Lepeophtheirus salmonis]